MRKPRLRKAGNALILAMLFVLSTGPASANMLREPTYQEKMALAHLVVIGTVTAIDRGGQGGAGSNATLSVAQRLKGEVPKPLPSGLTAMLPN
jgi:hypothetical protein